jgi:hypothetical protein
MRRTIVLIATLSLLAGAATALAARPHHHHRHAHHQARLTLAGNQPLTVRGHGFQRRERVRVVLRQGASTVTRHVRASRRGTFTATFPTAAGGPCGRPLVTASGSRGSQAVLKGVMRPMCMAS